MAEVDFGVDSLIGQLESAPKLSPRPYKTTRATSEQDKRRTEALANQRRKRSQLFDAGRQISPVKTVEHEHQLMMSEWLHELPCDFDTSWRMVVCPVGKRSLIIAKGGVTKVYTRKGVCVNKFQSALPGGRKGSYKQVTVLDAIFCCDQLTYFVMDVMVWNAYTYYDCETEFRFYWLRTKLEETPALSEVSKSNRYIFTPLDSYPCQRDTLSAILSHPLPQSIDGLLFFHNEAHYTAGVTPLTLWMTAEMAAERLGIIPSPEFLSSKFPDSSIRRQKKSQTHIHTMDAELPDESNDSMSEAGTNMVPDSELGEDMTN